MLKLCLRGRRKANLLVPIYLLCLTELRRLQASGGGVYLIHPLVPLRVSLGPSLQEYWLPPEVHFPPPREKQPRTLICPWLGRFDAMLWAGDRHASKKKKGEATLRIVRTPPGRLYCLQPNGQCVLLPQPLTTHSPRSVVPKTRPRAGLGTRRVGSVRGAHLHTTTSTPGHLNAPAYVNRFPPDWDSQLRPFSRNPLCFLTSQGR